MYPCCSYHLALSLFIMVATTLSQMTSADNGSPCSALLRRQKTQFHFHVGAVPVHVGISRPPRWQLYARRTYDNTEGWQRFASDPDNPVGRGPELQLVYAFLDQHLTQNQDRVKTLIDFGPGTGAKAAAIIGWLKERHNVITTYYAVDGSQFMAELAIKTVQQFLFSDSQSQRTQIIAPADFLNRRQLIYPYEQPNSGHEMTIAIFLGQTAGNFFDKDLLTILRNFKETLPSGAIFMMGVSLVPPSHLIPAIIQGYQTSDADFMMGPLMRGVPHLNGEYRVIYDRKDNSIYGYVVFNQPTVLPATPLITTSRRRGLFSRLTFERNDTLLLQRSHRFEPDELISLLYRAGFFGVQVHVSTSEGHPPHGLAIGIVP